jgi:epoxyqueuosine reductase
MEEVLHAPLDYAELAARIKAWGRALGLSQVAVTDVDLTHAEAGLAAWLAAGQHGEMDYMARHGMTRARPAALVPGTVRAIVARLDYSPPRVAKSEAVLAYTNAAFISRYTLGRDYHKILRRLLQQLADRIAAAIGPFGYRVFTDSAPVMEVELAQKAGLGWRGKHTLLLSRDAGSYYFLGEILVDLPLPADTPVSAHCGSCMRCIDACPTGAITAPYRLDARRCISYLTIEHKSAIPIEFRAAMGNRIYGCDDCQLACPWNKYAQMAQLADFEARHGLDAVSLLALWQWREADFISRFEGSAIRRIGYLRWRRNLAVALGNARRAACERGDALMRTNIDTALTAERATAPPLLLEHIDWAVQQGGATV